MGLVKSEELSNGNIGLEITYGGKEAPFGGVDTSAPPAYIDPRCFVSSDGVMVVDNKIVTVGMFSYPTALLWGGEFGVVFLKFGTFYNSQWGQLNYALGYISTHYAPSGGPSYAVYTYYITSWDPSNVTTVYNDNLSVKLFDSAFIAVAASFEIPCLTSGAQANGLGAGAVVNITSVSAGGAITGLTIVGGSGYVVGYIATVLQGSQNDAAILITAIGGGGSITGFTIDFGGGDVIPYTVGAASLLAVFNWETTLIINGPNGGPNTYIADVSVLSTLTAGLVVAAMVEAVNGLGVNPADPNVFASASSDGNSIILTAIDIGAAGNSITVEDASVNDIATLPPSFYFATYGVTNLQGGAAPLADPAPLSFTPPASVVEVGGVLYIANIGPMILKYNGPGKFAISTMNNGVKVLSKFAGSLIGFGYIPQLSQVFTATDMTYAWTSGENLDEWNPILSNGNVTGAGFEQLADIGDYISGLVISSGTAFIIRSQGVSYATATGNSVLPYAINHIGLGDRGEGAQNSNLFCQYDQTGAFVGNTNIYQISGQISAIGDKIKAGLFSLLNSGAAILSAAACSIFVGGDEFAVVVFEIGGSLFIFNTANGTWSTVTLPVFGTATIDSAFLGVFSSLNTFSNSQVQNVSSLVLAIQETVSDVLQAPLFYSLKEGVTNDTAISNNVSILFPQEELSIGRDVTIDALYVSLWADVSEDVAVSFYITGLVNTASPGLPAVYEPVEVLYATYTLLPAVFNSLDGDPIELQLSASNTFGVGAVTVHSPQLKITAQEITDSGTAKIRWSKKVMFGSFDSKQRPM